MSSFLNLTVSERLAALATPKDAVKIYDLLAKHLRCSVPELTSKYKISYQHVKQVISIESESSEDICELIGYLHRFGVRTLSVEYTEIRVDKSELLNKII